MGTFPHTIVQGRGPTILFEHGTLMDASMFAPQMDFLEASGFRSISHNSLSLTTDKGEHSLDDLVEDTRQLMDDSGLDRVVLAGMSVGAFMALDFALKHPERLDALVLIAGKAGVYTDQQQLDLAAGFKRCDVDGIVSREIAEWDAQYCFGRTAFEEKPDLTDYWIDRWSTMVPSRAVWHQVLSWLYKPDQTSRLHELRMPVLVIHGEEDAAIPINEAIDMLAHIKDVTFVRAPDAGHSVNLESPRIVNLALEAFLRRTYQDPAT